ncbi:MAG: hypothetical protein IKK11_00070 [Oscillospiraceae bacterium]|nr:hypothetical protein [Oscillospiraceae bacterium]
MKSRTYFFNKTVLRKDILRYCPIWALYTVFLLFTVFVMADSSPAQMADTLLDSLGGMAIVNLIYGGLCGAFLFMDLFNSRLCNAIHAFPVRREGWLATHVLSGILFSIVPGLVAGAFASLILWEYAYAAWIWFAVSTLQYLFFFGTAVLCAVSVGNLIGMGALYGIFHFITLLVQVMAELLYQPLLYGIRLSSNTFFRFFPIYNLVESDYVKFKIHYFDSANYVDSCYGELERAVGSEWLHLAICAGVGVVAVGLACLVYRRRHMESAGDFISLKPLSYLFVVVCTVGAGAFMYLLSEAFDSTTYVMLVIGMVIGYFASQMLLNRTLRVFGRKYLLGLGIMVAVVVASLGLTRLDPLGITRYVPDLNKVESATIAGSESDYYLSFNGLGSPQMKDVNGFWITDSEELEELTDFHRELIEYRPGETDAANCAVQVIYRLKNGRTVTRYYKVPTDSEVGAQAKRYFSDIRYLFDISDPDRLYNAFQSISIEYYKPEYLKGENRIQIELTDPDEMIELLDAIRADCDAGLTAQHRGFHDGKEINAYVEFSANEQKASQLGWDYGRFYLDIWDGCTNTIQWVEDKITAQGEILPEVIVVPLQ